MIYYKLAEIGLDPSILIVIDDCPKTKKIDITKLFFLKSPIDRKVKIVATELRTLHSNIELSELPHLETYYTKITAMEAQPIVTAWAQQSINLISKISKQKLTERRTA